MNFLTVLAFNISIVLVLGLLARFVKLGRAEPTQGGWNFNYSTSDIIILAVIAALAGVINTAMAHIWFAANSLNPLFGAFFQGWFMWAYILAFVLVRKPGAMLIVGLIESSMEIFLGNEAGFGTIGWGLTQGLAAEFVMLCANYKEVGWWVLGLVGAAASQFGTFWSYQLFGWKEAAPLFYWLSAPVELVTGFVFSGLLGWWLGKTVERTGLLRTTRKE